MNRRGQPSVHESSISDPKSSVAHSLRKEATLLKRTCLSLVVLTAASLLRAQTVAPPPQRETIEVTATKIAEDVTLVPQSITIIDGDEIRARGANDLTSALALTAGVSISPGGDGGPAGSVPEMWGLREVDAFLLVVDGVPWGGAFNPDLPSLDLTDVDRIEVLRGAAPVMYGATSFTGVIHVIHRQAGRSPWIRTPRRRQLFERPRGGYCADLTEIRAAAVDHRRLRPARIRRRPLRIRCSSLLSLGGGDRRRDSALRPRRHARAAIAVQPPAARRNDVHAAGAPRLEREPDGLEDRRESARGRPRIRNQGTNDLTNLLVTATVNGLPQLQNSGKIRVTGDGAARAHRRRADGAARVRVPPTPASAITCSKDSSSPAIASRCRRCSRPHSDCSARQPEGLTAHAELAYTGSRYLNKRNTAPAGGYSTLSAGIGYGLRRGSLRIDGWNLTNRRPPIAESEMGDAQYYRLPARALELSYARRVLKTGTQVHASYARKMKSCPGSFVTLRLTGP